MVRSARRYWEWRIGRMEHHASLSFVLSFIRGGRWKKNVLLLNLLDDELAPSFP
jgi:hypothetical protein